MRILVGRHTSCGPAADGEEAVRLARGIRPDVVMDINMPGMNGIEATRLIKEIDPEIGISYLPSMLMMNTCSRSSGGAGGYVLKDVDPANLAGYSHHP